MWETRGNNNTIILESPNFLKSTLSTFSDNNYVDIARTSTYVIGATIWVCDGGFLRVGEDCELGNYELTVVVNGDYHGRHGLTIGKGTHIARECIIRTADGESLVDPETKRPFSVLKT